MNLEHAQKLLAVSEETELIAINRSAAEDLSEYIGTIHTMLLGVEECTQTFDEFRAMLIRLDPDAATMMKHIAGMNAVVGAVVEHVFVTGSGDPSDVAKLRYQFKTLNDTGKLSLTG